MSNEMTSPLSIDLRQRGPSNILDTSLLTPWFELSRGICDDALVLLVRRNPTNNTYWLQQKDGQPLTTCDFQSDPRSKTSDWIQELCATLSLHVIHFTPIQSPAGGEMAFVCADIRPPRPRESRQIALLTRLHRQFETWLAQLESQQQLQTRLHSLIEHQSSGILSTDLNGRVRLFNSRLLEILGLTMPPDNDQPWQAVLLSEVPRIADQEALQKFLTPAFADPLKAHVAEFETIEAGTVEIESFPILEGARCNGHILTVRDLSDVRRTESLVEQQRLQIIEAQKLSALGEMASGLAHEINNPMAIIYGRATHLVEMAHQPQPLTNDQVATHSQHIVDVTQRVTKIIAGLRALSRDGDKDPLQTEIVSDVIEGTLAFCTERLKLAGIELRLSLGTENLKIQCRPVQVSQILLNLIQNAHDAILDLPEKWIEIEVISVFQEILIAVVDSGSGIPPNLRDKIFTPFFTTKPSLKGTGLGLSISQNMARAQGGDLQLDPNSTQTRFVLRLPSGI